MNKMTLFHSHPERVRESMLKACESIKQKGFFDIGNQLANKIDALDPDRINVFPLETYLSVYFNKPLCYDYPRSRPPVVKAQYLPIRKELNALCKNIRKLKAIRKQHESNPETTNR